MHVSLPTAPVVLPQPIPVTSSLKIEQFFYQFFHHYPELYALRRTPPDSPTHHASSGLPRPPRVSYLYSHVTLPPRPCRWVKYNANFAANIKDIAALDQRLGLESLKSVGGLSARDILKAVQRPSAEPYWKLRYKGACEDVFFLATIDRLEHLVAVMDGLAADAGYPVADRGVYVQPTVQGTSCHCEFNLFYDPDDKGEKERVRALAAAATKTLMDDGAFFSRPYGESSRMIMNRDAATVDMLKKMKRIFDPGDIMNPGKLCF